MKIHVPTEYKEHVNLRFVQPNSVEIASALMWANDLMKSGRVGEGMKHIENLLDGMVIDWKDRVVFPVQTYDTSKTA